MLMCRTWRPLQRRNEKTCWCLFRLGITNSKEGSKPFTRESFGRFSNRPEAD